jgi:bacterioferritin
MKGSSNVISILQKLLTYELASINQYFIHSEVYADMGLDALHQRISHEMDEEKDHAKLLIQRILFLEGQPDVTQMADMKIGSDVKTMLENDLDMELRGRQVIIDGIALCESESDFESREILEKLLFDTEEDHIYWLEQQLKLINLIGIENYLQKQMQV